MKIEVSPRREELISSLYDLRSKMPDISLDERLILDMAITMLEDLEVYAAGYDENLAKQAQDRSRIQWTRNEYHRLICSGGFELIEGRLIPKL